MNIKSGIIIIIIITIITVVIIIIIIIVFEQYRRVHTLKLIIGTCLRNISLW